ncbi:MAG: transposase [Desulfuromonadaceae bacterium]|nr:transposase [Desulfuromonadaceae bacterium]
MPRTARIVIPDYPHHIIQRGHNRQVVFSAEDDYRCYLDNLAEWKEAYECKIYAFCLMTNHVHLVINPGENPENLGKLMKRIAGRQTRYINRQEGRSGTLWEGRFKSSPIDSNGYLLACCRYVEMNPVVAGICADPADYPWSRCRSKVSAKEIEWLDLDPLYKSLAPLDDERRKRYREFLSETISDQEREMMSRAVQRGQLTGGASFIDEIERRLNRRIELRGQGRPRKAVK